jgi:hypothetical protein
MASRVRSPAVMSSADQLIFGAVDFSEAQSIQIEIPSVFCQAVSPRFRLTVIMIFP